MKELSIEEISLLEEMKSNCLKKGQYIDDKAKDKFKMLCHLEDFGIAYYDLLDVIKEVREEIRNVNVSYLGLRSGKSFIISLLIDILEILDKVGSDKE